MAERFVEHLDSPAEGESGSLHFEFLAPRDAESPLATELKQFFKGKLVLGLKSADGMPSKPETRRRLQGSARRDRGLGPGIRDQ